jgi:MraZ protein
MLRGSTTATVDGKGRLKIPTDFKSDLDRAYGQGLEFFVTSFDGKSVRVYPLPEWSKIEEKLDALPSTDVDKKRFLEWTNYYGRLARADAQGRVLIPAQLRESAEMHGEVAVLGYHKYLEVWNKERFREHLDSKPLTDEVLQNLSKSGI